jgi:hypothetical protein
MSGVFPTSCSFPCSLVSPSAHQAGAHVALPSNMLAGGPLGVSYTVCVSLTTLEVSSVGAVGPLRAFPVLGYIDIVIRVALDNARVFMARVNFAHCLVRQLGLPGHRLTKHFALFRDSVVGHVVRLSIVCLLIFLPRYSRSPVWFCLVQL